jgi:hypothetical protein
VSICGECGHDNPPDRRFCQSCRSFLEYTRVAAVPPEDADQAGSTGPLDVVEGAEPADSTAGAHARAEAERMAAPPFALASEWRG